MLSRAVVVTKPGEIVIKEVPIPKLRDDYILVKVKAVALNPTDWKHIDFMTTEGARIGCDYAGTVEDIGSNVTKPFKKGDRVCGFCHGGNEVNHEDGAFQDYIVAKGDIQINIPNNLSFEEACTLGVGITTVGQALYQSLGILLPNKPSHENAYLLIYGGSTATGSLAIQYAKLSGMRVLVTCSAQKFDYVKSLGADAAFDYKDPACSQQIKDFSADSVKYCFDCISEGASINIAISSMSSSGGAYTTLLPVPENEVHKINNRIQVKNTLAYTVVGESFQFGPHEVLAKPDDFEFGKIFWELSKELLGSGKVKIQNTSVNKLGDGLNGVIEGLDSLRRGKASSEKLVFTLGN